MVLVGHLSRRLPFLHDGSVPSNGSAGTGAGPTDVMSPLAASHAPGGSFSTPLESGRVAVPAASSRFQPGDDLCRLHGMLTMESSPFEATLDRFGPIQPGTAQRRVQLDDALWEEPQDQVG